MKSLKIILTIALWLTLANKANAQLWSPVGFHNSYYTFDVKAIGSNLFIASYNEQSKASTIGKWNGLFWSYFPSLNGLSSFTEFQDTMFATTHNWSMQDTGFHIYKLYANAWHEIVIPSIDTNNSDARLSTVSGTMFLHGALYSKTKGNVSVMEYSSGSWNYTGPAANPGIQGSISKIFKVGSKYVFANTYIEGTTNSNGLKSRALMWDGSNWSKQNNEIDSNDILTIDNDTIFYIKEYWLNSKQHFEIKKFINGSISQVFLTNTNQLYNVRLITMNGNYFLYGTIGGTEGIYLLKNNQWNLLLKASSAPYQLRLFDKLNNQIYASSDSNKIIVKLSTSFAYIKGNVFKDANNNCTKDNNEQGLKNSRMVHLAPDNVSTLVNLNGDYFFVTTAGSKTLTTQKLYPTKYLIPSSCSSISKSVTTFTDSIKTVDFPLKDSANVTDAGVRISAIGGYRVRKNGNNAVTVTVANPGTTTISSGTVVLKFDPLFTVVSANPSYSSLVNNTATWNYTNLMADSIKRFEIILQLSSTATEGDSVTFKASITPHPDADTTDNKDSLKCKIVNSFDPNDKQNSPAYEITKVTTSLNYTVNFQNTGTAEAINVVVVDTVDTDLPIDKIVITGWSTPVRPWIEVKDNRILVFTFSNIMLPDSHSNEPKSHGHISYRFALTMPMLVGTIIKNRADIYFDYNEPVLTNVTENICVEKLGIKTSNNNNNLPMEIYPNPAKDKLIITLDNKEITAGTIRMFDLNGRLVLTSEMKNVKDEISLNIAGLENGIYILSIYDENELLTTRKIAVLK